MGPENGFGLGESMDYIELLRESAEKNGSVVCLGMDPVLERIPIQEGSTEDNIFNFYSDILMIFKLFTPRFQYWGYVSSTPTSLYIGRPVPAGMSRPIITFSFRPLRLSTDPAMLASVRTLVVS